MLQRLFLLWSASALLSQGLQAEDFSFFWNDIELRSNTLRGEGAEYQMLELALNSQTNVASLDDEDLWVVSRNGYNALAELAGVEKVGFDRHPDEGPGPFDAEVSHYLATYRVKPRNEGDTWTRDDNGTYTVLLEPSQIVQNGTPLEPRRLGTFRIAVGEPEPVAPTAELPDGQSFEYGQPVGLTVIYRDEAGIDLKSIDAGDLEFIGADPDFFGETFLSWDVETIESKAGGQVVTVQYLGRSCFGAHGLPGSLLPGDYTATLTPGAVSDIDGLTIGNLDLGSFEVTGDLPPIEPPQDAEVSVSLQRKEYVARATVDLAPGTFVARWGTPVLQDGNLFTVEITLGSIPSLNEPEQPDDFWWSQTQQSWGLGQFAPGDYEFQLIFGGETLAETRFTAEKIDPNEPDPPVAGVFVEEGADGYQAFLEIHSPTGESFIINEERSGLEGDLFRIEVQPGDPADPDLSFDDPDVIGFGPFLFYSLGRPEPGPYRVEAIYNGEVIGDTEFDARRIDPPIVGNVDVEIEQSGGEATAVVTGTLLKGYALTDPGKVRFSGNTFYIGSLAESDADEVDERFEARYPLLPYQAPDGLGEEIAFKTLDTSTVPNFPFPFEWVISSEEEWEELFRILPEGEFEPVPAPPVDLEENTLIFITTGEEVFFTGDLDLKFTKVVQSQDHLIAAYEAIEPVGGGETGKALIAIPKTRQPILFEQVEPGGSPLLPVPPSTGSFQVIFRVNDQEMARTR
ncbi:MAG: hypothetical protein AAF514_13870 [Verrucomicrobiota bacterium]